MEKNAPIRVLILDNYDSFTYNLVDYFESLNAIVQVVRNHVSPTDPGIQPFSHLVLSPGPGQPEHSGNLMNYIETFQVSKPILGVCLGLQALVTFFGGRLEQAEPVHGKTDQVGHKATELFDGLPSPLTVGRYHSIVATEVNFPLEITAMNNKRQVMAIQHKDLPIAGVQFHPESILTYPQKNGLRLLQNFLTF